MHIEKYLLPENGKIPNNPRLPVLLYRKVFDGNLKDRFSESFLKNGWGGHWINGVYDFHHYHSTAHEVLGVTGGAAEIVVGGPDGKVLDIIAGDMVILPAGTGHCRIYASENFKVLGAYPLGQEDYDTCTEKDDVEHKKNNISGVPLPEHDPVENAGGVLRELWK